jgi:hypothetical protein
MENNRTKVAEEIQKIVAGMIATHPVGRGLSLIGGVRFRLLNESPRMSIDIDYHWEGLLTDKQQEIVVFLKRMVIPEVRRRFDYEGTATAAAGPETDSAFVKVVDLAFYKPDVAGSRIEVPLDITRIERLDKPAVRTRGGVVYLTVSDADMVESKVIALITRTYIEARDMVDLFLFTDFLKPQSKKRVMEKFSRLSVSRAVIAGKIKAVAEARAVHIRNIEEIIASQIEPETARRLREGGGAAEIFDRVADILRRITAPEGQIS